MRQTRATTIVLALCVWLAAAAAVAQEPAASPSFSVATSHVFNSRERAAISLTYRQVDHLDFRVYRVSDAFAFFARLKDPHQLGSEEPIVPQEQTWLERIAAWKSARRADVRRFVRAQFSSAYRRVRRERQDEQQVVLRQTLNVNSFAQVPLLNASQLVTSWREVLPPVREAEYRRIPLDLPGPGVFVVEAVYPPLRAYTVVIVSDVGLVTKTAPGSLLVYAADRFTGEPLANCAVRLISSQQTIGEGTTAADGTFAAQVTTSDPDNLVTLASCNGQIAATDPGAYTIQQPTRTLAGYIYTDRPVYRPGHEVHFKGVLRWRENGALVSFGQGEVELSIVDDGGKVLLRERRKVDEFGALNGTFRIPAAATLGFYSVRVVSGEQEASGTFEVQEYRKPEFDVAVRPSAKFELQGSRTRMTVSARYYFGQPVAGGRVHYVLQKAPYYSPLRSLYGNGDEEGFDGYFYGGDEVLQGTATLDAAGSAEISVPLAEDEDRRDYTARLEARVMDASGREVSGAAATIATYGRILIAARPDRYVYAPGQASAVAIRVLDYDGAPQPDVAVHGLMQRVEYRDGYRNRVTTTVAQVDLVTDAEGRAEWRQPAPSGQGSYEIRLTAPSEGRQVTETVYLYVTGRQSAEMYDGDRFLELIADRRSYEPGETAQLIVRGAEFEAPVLVAKENQHISYHQVIRTRSNEAIAVPIGDEDIGDTYVSIAFLKDDRLFRAERRLNVPATRRQLTITAETDRPIVRPGEPGTFTLKVVDASGAPVQAQLSVGLVDEAIYGVRPDSTPDPLRFFYRREYNMVSTSFSREYPFVGYSGTEQLLLARRRRPLSLADFKADRPDRPRVRKDFPDTAFWAADVTTDASGTAQVKIDYPDSLTSWRLTVRGITADTEVGATRTNTTTTKDLILRVVTPRFLTEGDEVRIPAIVHNYLPSPANVSVDLSADGLTPMDTAAPGTRPLQVPQNGVQRTDWAYKAEQVRPVTLTGRATSEEAGDAMQVTLPVLPAGLQRNAGSSGSMLSAGERSIDLTIPESANQAGRSVRISLAPSLAGTMLGALDYLTSFPWGCTEQTLSSFVPDLIVLRALEQMQITPTERLSSLDRQVADGLKRLYDYQHDDGGWGWWKTDENHPFMTAYAVDGLVKAKENGVRVDEWRISNAVRALQGMYAEYPRAIPDLKAYMVYAIARAEGEETDDFTLDTAIDELWAARARMTASGRALLLMLLDGEGDARGDTLAGELMASAETRGDVSWWQVPNDPLLDDFGDTSVEASALVLKALSSRDPQNPLLERVARWIVASRTNGYWFNTKQTALALDGLLAYMQARGERPAPASVDVYVNGTQVGTTRFDAQSLVSPQPVLVEVPGVSGANTVRLVKQGEGAIYYDASVRYYDRPAAEERTGSRRLAIVREYFSLVPIQRNGRIVYREQPFRGTAQAGELIRVRLTTAGASDWKYLILEDPIPAGTEQVEKENLYELERRPQWYWGSQRELRDDRTVFFLNDFVDGRYEFSYLLKVTTPGVFNAMPARIAPMYVPGVSASSNVSTVTVRGESVR